MHVKKRDQLLTQIVFCGSLSPCCMSNAVCQLFECCLPAEGAAAAVLPAGEDESLEAMLRYELEITLRRGKPDANNLLDRYGYRSVPKKALGGSSVELKCCETAEGNSSTAKHAKKQCSEKKKWCLLVQLLPS